MFIVIDSMSNWTYFFLVYCCMHRLCVYPHMSISNNNSSILAVLSHGICCLLFAVQRLNWHTTFLRWQWLFNDIRTANCSPTTLKHKIDIHISIYKISIFHTRTITWKIHIGALHNCFFFCPSNSYSKFLYSQWGHVHMEIWKYVLSAQTDTYMMFLVMLCQTALACIHLVAVCTNERSWHVTTTAVFMLLIITRVIKHLTTLLTCEILHIKNSTHLCMLVLQTVCSCEIFLRCTITATFPVTYNLYLFITSCHFVLFTCPCCVEAAMTLSCLCVCLYNRFF